jgi:hypothetical protein
MRKNDRGYERPSESIVVELDGVTYRGSYTVGSGMITVGSAELGRKSALLGNSARFPEHLARMLLRELVMESRAMKRDPKVP